MTTEELIAKLMADARSSIGGTFHGATLKHVLHATVAGVEVLGVIAQQLVTIAEHLGTLAEIQTDRAARDRAAERDRMYDR